MAVRFVTPRTIRYNALGNGMHMIRRRPLLPIIREED